MINEMHMNETQLEIKRWVDRLDQVAIKYESRWGIGFLQEVAPPDIKTKWAAQQDKFADAIHSQDIRAVQDLVNGFIRGWALLEEKAIEGGHKAIEPTFMEVKLESGFVLRIAANHADAARVSKEGVYTYCLEGIARMVEKDYTMINAIKKEFPDAVLYEVKDSARQFDWKEGDEIPW